jgi:hypothetical protein
MGSGTKSGATASMLRGSAKRNVVPLRETSIVIDDEAAAADEGLLRLDTPRRFPIVSSLPRMPLMIPDEILDYYGWVFCQGGFLNLQMTFEQFLTVVAAVSPTGLCPEYDEGIRIQTSD